jgi:hypothetical protein
LSRCNPLFSLNTKRARTNLKKVPKNPWKQYGQPLIHFIVP